MVLQIKYLKGLLPLKVCTHYKALSECTTESFCLCYCDVYILRFHRVTGSGLSLRVVKMFARDTVHVNDLNNNSIHFRDGSPVHLKVFDRM